MVSKGCSVFSFDPSMTDTKKHKRNEKNLFEPIGIGTNDGMHKGESTLYGKTVNYQVETLESIMKRHGHSYLTTVRLDVEGAEWDVLEQLIDKGWTDRIDQLLLETHMHKPEDITRYNRILHKLPWSIFHSQQNKWDNYVLYRCNKTICNYTAHDVAEYSVLTRVYEVGFMTLDRPTRSTLSSIKLRWYGMRQYLSGNFFEFRIKDNLPLIMLCIFFYLCYLAGQRPGGTQGKDNYRRVPTKYTCLILFISLISIIYLKLMMQAFEAGLGTTHV